MACYAPADVHMRPCSRPMLGALAASASVPDARRACSVTLRRSAAGDPLSPSRAIQSPLAPDLLLVGGGCVSLVRFGLSVAGW